MTLVFKRELPGAGTHALVFGVGRFPFLDGSNQELPADMRRVETVTSPPRNATEFAKWLIEAKDDLIPPLASIELLFSPEDTAVGHFAFPCSPGDPRADDEVEPATGVGFSKAAQDWLQRAETDPDNLAVLYCSSHGFQGQEHVLLFEDAGQDQMEPWRNMLSIDHVRRNLFAKRQKRSIIFADCCRDLLESSSTSLDAISGRRIGNVTARQYAQLHQDPSRAVYSLRAAPFGKVAKATRNGLGYFTESLLHCLRGKAGSRDFNVGWSIDPSSMRRSVKETGFFGLNYDLDPRDEESHWVGPPFVRLKMPPCYPVRIQDAKPSNNDFVDLRLSNAATGYSEDRPAAAGAGPLNAWVPPTFDAYLAGGFNKMTNLALVDKSVVIVSGGADIRLESQSDTT